MTATLEAPGRLRRGAYELLPPTYHNAPAYDFTFGPEVGAFCAQVGLTPDPEQQLALDDVLAVNDEGLPAAFEYGLIGPRQNLKTGWLKMLAIGWLYVLDIDDIGWSAHLVSTALSAHGDLADMIQAAPVLRKRMPGGRTKGITASKTDGRIELANGNALRFTARTEGGGRGLTGKRVIMDEALGLTPGMLGALLPTLTAMEDAQAVYASTAGKLESIALRDKRDAGRSGKAGALGWAEWCAEFRVCAADEAAKTAGGGEGCAHWPPGHPGHVEGCALDDEELWAQAMPLLGRRRANGTGLSLARVRELRSSMPPAEFGREMLGWWDDPSSVSVFGAGNWEAATATWTTEDGQEFKGYPTPVDFPLQSLGVAISADLSTACVAGAGMRGDDIAVRVIATGVGYTWTLDTITELREKFPGLPVVFDPGGPTGTIKDALLRVVKPARRVKPVTFAQWIAACANFYNGVKSGTTQHGAQHELDESVREAQQRRVQDRWVWERYGYNAAPLEAATLAAWGIEGARSRSAYEDGRGVLTV